MLLHDEKVRRGRSSKLSPPYIGLYEIISVDGVNITLQLPRNYFLVELQEWIANFGSPACC